MTADDTESTERCQRVEPEVGFEHEGPTCVTHNDAWGECRTTPADDTETQREEDCRRCGRHNPSWSAQSPLWNKVMRGNDINGDSLFSDLVCVPCFIDLATDAGVQGQWRVTVSPTPDDLIYETPSGRVWDDVRWLWVEPTVSDAAETRGRDRRSLAAIVGAMTASLGGDLNHVIDLGGRAADAIIASNWYAAARAAGDDLAVEREGDDYVVKVSCDYDIDRIEELLESVAALAYEKFPHLNPLVHGHRRECEESDHCCGPGSNYLRDHDAEVLTTDRERVALAIEDRRADGRAVGDATFNDGLNHAARIARTNPGEGGAE